MKTTYWQRLKEHPGVSVAFMMTLMMNMGALSNKSIPSVWEALLFGTSVSLIFWAIILISNFKKKAK